MSSYLKDSRDVINSHENLAFDPNTQLLLGFDIISLYTNIPQQASLEAIEEILLGRTDKDPVPTSFILWCVELALKRNYFEFNGRIFQQTEGTAMGATMAPSVANLYVETFEKSNIYSNLNPYNNNIVKWSRYIDDILVIWRGTLTEANNFFNWLNNRNPHLQFTMTSSNELTNFLDLTIFASNGVLKIKPYHKPTDKNSLLEYSSHHIKHLRDNLPFGQFLRLKRNSSTKETYEAEADTLAKKLRQRGYPKKLVQKAAKRAFNNNREALLEPKPVKPKDDRIVCVSTFSNQSFDITNIIKKNWKIFQSSSPTMNMPIFAYKKSTTIGNRVSNSKLKSIPIQEPRLTTLWGLPEPTGHYPCGSCGVCKLTSVTKNIDVGLSKLWTQKNLTNCNTEFVVYLITCKCGLHYVGKTTRKAKVRIMEHRSCLKNRTENAPMVKHFNLLKHHYEDFKWTILLSLKGSNYATREKKLFTMEQKMIYTLQSDIRGLNDSVEWYNI
ncbi:uncharacterized protein [Ambystoma mexicanum]